MILLGAAFFLVNTVATLSETLDRPNEYYCQDHHPQRTLDLDQVMGLWNIIEIIHHRRENKWEHGAVFLSTCPSIHIARESRSELRLVWSEKALTVYYTIRLSDPNTPGFWVASGPHSMTESSDGHQHEFTGTIQVMKAVASHMALTFCTRHPNLQLFSVLLAREERLTSQQILGVNNMLQRRNLDAVFVKHACSSAFRSTMSTLTIFLVSILLLL